MTASPFTDASLATRVDLRELATWTRRQIRCRDNYASRSAAAEGTVPCGCGRNFRTAQSVSVHRGRTGCKGLAGSSAGVSEAAS